MTLRITDQQTPQLLSLNENVLFWLGSPIWPLRTLSLSLDWYRSLVHIKRVSIYLSIYLSEHRNCTHRYKLDPVVCVPFATLFKCNTSNIQFNARQVLKAQMRRVRESSTTHIFPWTCVVAKVLLFDLHYILLHSSLLSTHCLGGPLPTYITLMIRMCTFGCTSVNILSIEIIYLVRGWKTTIYLYL